MRKLTTLIIVMVLAAVVFLAGTTSSMAVEKKARVGGIVSIFSGTYQHFAAGTTGTTSGPFMCPGVEELVIATVVWYFLDGICDDVQPNSSGLPVCGGRFTSRDEGCHDPTFPGRDIKIDSGPSSVLSVNGRGQRELCFASAASSALPADCWGAGGTAGLVYATGTTLAQTKLILGLTGGPLSVTTEITLTSSTNFKDVNGIKVEPTCLTEPSAMRRWSPTAPSPLVASR